MRLKSLEVVGFKSFVDRVHITFPEGITAIVGPNGCGKSNIVDAILWVIGERSAKHLRGKHMEDVIFSGADGRKPLGMAEVHLSFSNEDGFSPSGYEQYSEITVTRRLFRSGESEYLINKVPCRLRDVIDLFLDTGIGVNGYSIVEQGRVESLINSNPQDRRFLIEEAGGIAKYKERKRLALMKIEAAQQNLVRIQDIIAEVKRQITTLERQVKRAEEYKAIRKEIKEIEQRFALQEYGELSERAEASRGYLKALQQREAEIAAEASGKEVLIEAMRLKGIEEEERLRSLQQEVFDLGRTIQRLEGEIEFCRREREGLEKGERESLVEVREAFRAWREARREGRDLEASRQDFDEQCRRGQEALEEIESRFSEARERYQRLLNESEEIKGRLIDTLTDLTSMKNRLSHLEERREDLQRRIRSNREESDRVRQEVEDRKEALSQKTRERERNLALRSALQEEKSRWEGELEALKAAFGKKQTERAEAEEALRLDRSRYLSLRELQDNFEGYEKGVKAILLGKKNEEARWRGVLGTVADILEPKAGYEVPLEAVLGPRLQAVLVEDMEKGAEAIAFLKEGSLGRGIFIPRELREVLRQGSKPLREEGPKALLRYVTVKEGFESIAEELIGHVGIVESWEEALRSIDGDFPVLVTQGGDVLERSGAMGGGSWDQGLGLLERRREMRELEERIHRGEEAYEALRNEEEGLRQAIAGKERELDQRRKEIQEKEIELLHQERDLEELRRELARLEEKEEVLHFEGAQLEEEDQEIENEKQDLVSRMGSGEMARREQEERVQGLKTLVGKVQEENERLAREMTERKVLLASLEEKRKGIEFRRDQLEITCRALREQISRKMVAIREGREKMHLLSAQMGDYEREVERSLVAYRQKEEVLREEKEKVEEMLSQLRELEASTRYFRQEMDDLRRKIHEEEMRLSELQLRLEHLQDSMKERYGLTLAPGLGGTTEALPREEMSRRLEELKASLDGFGEVNLLALEEYQELQQRYRFLSEQQADLQQALESLRKAIARINRTTTRRFLETFHLVNEKFKEVFVRLFRGGQASLVLVDEENPATSGVDIIAQPPGKKLQNIDLLSGGEKALVATALLFGLFMIKPTPFCLLDEADAPLDDANINRYLDLIKDFSKTSQFILITHNKKTMETAQTLYGITMETPGVSKVVSVRLN